MRYKMELLSPTVRHRRGGDRGKPFFSGSDVNSGSGAFNGLCPFELVRSMGLERARLSAVPLERSESCGFSPEDRPLLLSNHFRDREGPKPGFFRAPGVATSLGLPL